MKRHQGLHLKRERILRFLTLLFFFHFSGLNNGYTYHFIATARPAQSAAQIQPFLQRCGGAIRSAQAASVLRSFHRLITEETARLRSWASGQFAAVAGAVPSIRAESSALSSVKSGFSDRPSPYLKKREAWAATQKQGFDPEALNGFLAGEVLPSVEKALVNPLGAWVEAHQVILRMSSRRMGGADDDAEPRLPARSHRIPGPSAGDFYCTGVR